MADPPAGWLPDPTGRHTHRYWDGARWTEHVADDGVPTVDPYEQPEPPSVLTWRPPPVRPVLRPSPDPEPEPEPEDLPVVPRLSGWLAEPSPVPVPPPRPATPAPGAPELDPEASYRRGWIFIGLGAAILLVALVLVLTRGDGDDQDDGGSSAGRTPRSSVDVRAPASGDELASLPDAPSPSDVATVPGLTAEDLEEGLGLTDAQARCFSQALAGAASRGDDTTDRALLGELLRRCDADPAVLGAP